MALNHYETCGICHTAGPCAHQEPKNFWERLGYNAGAAWYYETRGNDLAHDVVRLKMENANLKAAMRAAVKLLTWHERKAKPGLTLSDCAWCGEFRHHGHDEICPKRPTNAG